MSDMTAEELSTTVAALARRVEELEARVAELEGAREVPEEDLVAIGAAVAAYFGHKAKIRAVRFGGQSGWAAATRDRVHDRHVPHTR